MGDSLLAVNRSLEEIFRFKCNQWMEIIPNVLLNDICRGLGPAINSMISLWYVINKSSSSYTCRPSNRSIFLILLAEEQRCCSLTEAIPMNPSWNRVPYPSSALSAIPNIIIQAPVINKQQISYAALQEVHGRKEECRSLAQEWFTLLAIVPKQKKFLLNFYFRLFRSHAHGERKLTLQGSLTIYNWKF